MEHNDYPYMAPKEVVQHENSHSEEESKFVDLMYLEGVDQSQMVRIISAMKGHDVGTFLPKTMYNMNKKSQEMLQLFRVLQSI